MPRALLRPGEHGEQEGGGGGHPREYPGHDRRLQLPESGRRERQQVYDREADGDADSQQLRRGPTLGPVATEDDRHDDGKDQPLWKRDERELTEPGPQSVIDHVRDVMRGQQGEDNP